MIIIGCDPDSKASGIARYSNGSLIACESMSLFQIYKMFESIHFAHQPDLRDIELHIEDVKGNRCSSFNWKPSDNRNVRAKKSENVGQCKQVQIEIERIAEHFGIKVVRHKVSSAWKSQAGKAQFERFTGWTGRSNEDSRSAAWFGYQGVLMNR